MDYKALTTLGLQQRITGIVHLVTGGMPGGVTPLELGEDIRSTVTSIANVLQAARDWNVKRVTIAGAPVEYNGVTATPWREDQPLALTAAFPMEAAKKCGEIVSSLIGQLNQIECIQMRLPAMYGPNYVPTRSNLAGRLVHAAVKGTQPRLEEIRFGSTFSADGGDQCYTKERRPGDCPLTDGRPVEPSRVQRCQRATDHQ